MIDQLASLSDREIEVLKLVATGATNLQIARDLGISPNTVKVHLRNIFEKLGVQSRTEATMEAVRRGWVCVDGTVIEVPEAEPAAEPMPEPELLAPPEPPIALWQRVYMFAAAGLVILALFLPNWWQARSTARLASAFSDTGRAVVPPAVRTDIARWVERAPLPEARDRFALLQLDGKLYAIGGETARGITGQVAIFDPASNGWLPGADKPRPVSNVSAAVVDGRIYVPGGVTSPGTSPAPVRPSLNPFASPLAPQESNEVTAALEIYDPKTDRWSTGAPMPEPRAAYALAALGGRLYLFGGWDGGHYRADTFIYDPGSNTWSVGTPLPGPRAFLGAAPLQGVVYLAGGYDGQNELKATLAYDPRLEGSAGGPWSEKAALNQPRSGLALLALANRLYAIGGGLKTPLSFNEQYDTASGAWSRIESPVSEQWRNLGLAGLNEKIYAVGGWGGDYLAVNEEYQAIYRVLLPVGSTR